MHVILFDIDGTLIDTRGAGRDAMIAALTAEFNIPSESDGVVFAGRTDRAIVGDLFRRFSIEETKTNWTRFCTTFLKRLPEFLRLRDGHVLPGVVELLDRLRSRPEIVLGLLTGNLREGARSKLNHYGLFEYFTTGGLSLGGFGDTHPDRDDVAHEAIAAVGKVHHGEIDVRRVWVIGDTPSDVQCARAIQANAVAVTTGVHAKTELARARPDLLLTDLSDPSPLLERLEA